MAHQINVENGRANVMVVGKPAWHNLGQVLQNPATSEQAIREAGLDFTVEKKPLFLEDGTGVPNRFATVRTDLNRPLGVVTSRYEVLQNTDAFRFFDKVVDRDEAVYHSAGVLGQGERIWIMAKLPEHISIKGIDDVNVYVTLMSGHDGKTGVYGFVHLERIVCNNTLQVAMSEGKRMNKFVRFGHRTGIIDRVSDGASLLGIVNHYRKEMDEIFTTLSAKQVNTAYTKAFVDALFPAMPDDVVSQMKRTPAFKIQREQVLEAIEVGAGQDMPTARGTAWGLFNGVTYWVDHVKKGTGNDASKKQSSIWFGDGARVRQRAFDLLTNDRVYEYA
jgi:phage/plasmid-like protein (TIGR03299 family)